MRPKAELTIPSQKSRANNLIVLAEFLLKFPSKNDFNYFWSENKLRALEYLSGLNCQLSIVCNGSANQITASTCISILVQFY